MSGRARRTVLGIGAFAVAVTIFVSLRYRSEALPPKLDGPATGVEPSPLADAPGRAEGEAVEPAVVAPAALTRDDRAIRDSGRGRIFGTVRLADGGALPGDTRVTLHRVDVESPLASFEDTFVAATEPAADGRIEFLSLPLGTYTLYAAATGYTAEAHAYLTPDRVEQEARWLHMQPGGTVSGKIVNAAGQPVEGAQVFHVASHTKGERQIVGRNRALSSRTITLADGSFVMENFRIVAKDERKFVLAVRADGYATFLSNPVPAETRDLEFALSEGNVVAGRLVYAESGKPAGDKIVVLNSDVNIESPTARSDIEGFFFLSNVPDGTHTVSLIDPELVITPETAQFRVGDKADDPLTLLVAGGGGITGRVYDAETGAGLRGVRLAAFVDGAGPRVPRQTTDTDGAYTFKGLRPGSYRVEFETPGGYGQRYDYGSAETYRMVVANIGAEVGNVDFPLSAGIRVSGHVVDESGKGIGQGTVDAYATKGEGSDQVQTADDGSFVAAGFSLHQEVQIRAAKDGYALLSVEPADGKVTIDADRITDVRLVLGEEATIAGVVVDSTGNPKGNVEVHAGRTDSKPVRSTARTVADGSFTLRGLPPAEYRIVAYYNDRWSSDDPKITTPTVAVAKGEHRTGVRVVVSDEVGGLTISGRVTDVAGNPISDASVWIEDGIRRAHSDTSGQYTLSGVEPGAYQIFASGPAQSTSQPVTAQAGAIGVNFVLKGLAAIEGRVVNKLTQLPVTVFRVQRQQPRDSNRSADTGIVSSVDGKFRMTDLEEGDITLKVRAEGFVDATVPVGEVRGGETRREVVVQMEEGIRVAGRVIDGTGRGIGGTLIYLGSGPSRNWNEEDRVLATSGPDGSFTLTSLPAGKVQIAAVHAKFAMKAVTLDLLPGTENRTEIVLSSGGDITGVVTVNGKPAAEKSVSVYFLNQSRSAGTDANGRYEISGVPAGQVRLSWHVEGGTKDRTVSVIDGAVIEANFDFTVGTSSIEGTVYEAPNVPVRTRAYIGATLEMPDGSRERRGVEVNQDGHFAFEGLQACQVRLAVSMDGRSGKTVNVDVGERQRVLKDIQLYGGATVLVSVTGTDNLEGGVVLLSGRLDIPEISVETFMSLEDRMVSHSQIINSAAQLGGVEAGTYTVLAVAINPNQATESDPLPGARWATTVIEVGKDEEVAVRLDL